MADDGVFIKYLINEIALIDIEVEKLNSMRKKLTESLENIRVYKRNKHELKKSDTI